MTACAAFIFGFWLAGALLTFRICEAIMWQRLLSAAPRSSR